jgi:hypothetical protein
MAHLLKHKQELSKKKKKSLFAFAKPRQKHKEPHASKKEHIKNKSKNLATII